jgi:hypothetical protein
MGLSIVLTAALSTRASAALQQYAYFSWNASGGATFSANLVGVSGNLLFTTTGDDILYHRTYSATDSNFISKFDAELPSLFFENSAADPTADALAQAAFTPALPAGARLLLIDVDQAGAQERVQLSRVGGSLSLLEQIESRTGENSQFPTWSPVTGVLQSVGSNEGEASVFDVSGARALDLWYRRGIGGGGVSGSYFVIALPVPEPAGLLLAALAMTVAVAFRGKGSGSTFACDE